MRHISLIGIGTIVLGLSLGAAACSSDEDDGDGAAGSGNTSSGTNSGGSGAEGGSGNGSGGSSSGGSGSSSGGAGSGGSGSGGALAFCAQSCAEAADCCPDGLPNCPGPDYPTNYGCEEGICVSAQCATDDDCSFGGTVPGQGCLNLSDFHVCSPICDTDADCPAAGGLTCTGEDDDGKKYCTGPAPAGCTTDADCPAGYGGICDVDSGACTCGEDTDCSGAGVDTCVEP